MNIAEIARKAGVGKATVSRVLNGGKNVSEKTEKRVRDICDEFNYTPNYFASNLIKGQTNVMGLFLEVGNEKWYDYYYGLLQGCILKAFEYNMQILPYFALPAEKISENLMPGKSPLAGALLLTPAVKEKRLIKLEHMKIPCVVIGKLDNKEDEYLSVDINNRKLVTNFLLHLADKGHKRIAFINSRPTITITQDRDKAVTAFMRANSDIKVYTRYCCGNERDTVREYESILSEDGSVKAVIVASDSLAKELYDYFEVKGLKIGKDVSVISLGGNQYKDKLSPKLTCGFQDYCKIGSMGIELLMKRIRNEVTLPHIFIDSEIIWGESVCEVKDA